MNFTIILCDKDGSIVGVKEKDVICDKKSIEVGQNVLFYWNAGEKLSGAVIQTAGKWRCSIFCNSVSNWW